MSVTWSTFQKHGSKAHASTGRMAYGLCPGKIWTLHSVMVFASSILSFLKVQNVRGNLAAQWIREQHRVQTVLKVTWRLKRIYFFSIHLPHPSTSVMKVLPTADCHKESWEILTHYLSLDELCIGNGEAHTTTLAKSLAVELVPFYKPLTAWFR